MEAFVMQGLPVYFQWEWWYVLRLSAQWDGIFNCQDLSLAVRGREKLVRWAIIILSLWIKQQTILQRWWNDCPNYPVNFVQVGYFIQAESLVPYSEKLSREKLSQLSWLFTKVFSTKFGIMVSFGTVKASNPRTFSPWKLYISPIHKSFLPRKFPTTWYRNMQFRKFSIESSTVLCTMPAQQTQCVRMLSLCVQTGNRLCWVSLVT